MTINLEKCTKLSGFRFVGLFPCSYLGISFVNMPGLQALAQSLPAVNQVTLLVGCLTKQSSWTLEFTTTFSRHNCIYQKLCLNMIFSLCVEVKRIARYHKWALHWPECKNHLHYFLIMRLHEEGVVSWTVSKRYVTVLIPGTCEWDLFGNGVQSS